MLQVSLAIIASNIVKNIAQIFFSIFLATDPPPLECELTEFFVYPIIFTHVWIMIIELCMGTVKIVYVFVAVNVDWARIQCCNHARASDCRESCVKVYTYTNVLNELLCVCVIRSLPAELPWYVVSW